MPRAKSAPDLSVAKELEAAAKALRPAVDRLRKTLAKLDPAALPVGALCDTLYDMRQLSGQLKALSAPFEDALGPAQKAVEDQFIQTLAVGEASGAQGGRARVQVTESVLPTLENPTKFYAFVRRTNGFDLLNRALNRKAVEERWDNHKQVPGVGKFHVKKVSCTKLGGKK